MSLRRPAKEQPESFEFNSSSLEEAKNIILKYTKGKQMFEKYLIRQFFLLNYLLKQPRTGPASSK